MSRFGNGKFIKAAARAARTGAHGPTAGPLEVSFNEGDTVRLRNGNEATIKKKESWGDYTLEEYPGNFFSPGTLTLVKRKDA